MAGLLGSLKLLRVPIQDIGMTPGGQSFAAGAPVAAEYWGATKTRISNGDAELARREGILTLTK
jgi:hypothetical protein